MNTSEMLALDGIIVFECLLSVLFWRLHRRTANEFHRWWMWAWVALTLSFAFGGLYLLLPPHERISKLIALFASVVMGHSHTVGLLFAVVCLQRGDKIPGRTLRFALVTIVAIGVATMMISWVLREDLIDGYATRVAIRHALLLPALGYSAYAVAGISRLARPFAAAIAAYGASSSIYVAVAVHYLHPRFLPFFSRSSIAATTDPVMIAFTIGSQLAIGFAIVRLPWGEIRFDRFLKSREYLAWTQATEEDRALLHLQRTFGQHVVGYAVDVAEHEEMLDTFRHHEAEFRIVFEQAAVGIVFCTPDGRFLRANPRFQEIVGYSEEELRRMTFREITHPDDLERDLTMAARLFAREWKRYSVEKRYIRKDGTIVWVNLDVTLIWDSQGTPVAGIGVIEDVTERVESAEEIRRLNTELESRVEQRTVELDESRRFFETLAGSAPIGIFRANAAGDVTYCNEWALDVWRCPQEERSTRNWLVGLSVEDRNRWSTRIRASLEAAGPVVSEVHFSTSGGEESWLSVSTVPDFDLEGNVIGLVGTIADVTARIEGERRELEDRRTLTARASEWEATFDAVQAPILLLDSDGSVRRANEAARDAIGVDFREIINHRLDVVSTCEPWTSISAALIAGPRSSTIDAVDEQSGRAWEIDVSAPSSDDSETQRTIAIVRDVTEVRALAEARRRDQNMLEMGALVAAVCHEVRNPLFTVSAAIDALAASKGFAPGSEPLAEVLREAVDRLAGLMNDLLEYARPSRAELRLENLGATVQRAVDSTLPLATQRGIELSCDLSAISELRVRHDGKRLLQVFINLIENAIQHTPSGKRVVVQSPESEEHASEVVVEVCDDGSGFLPGDATRAFQPFYSRRKGGTGLGLTIARRIIEEHNGMITIASRVDGGSVVRVTLPVSAVAELVAEETAGDRDGSLE